MTVTSKPNRFPGLTETSYSYNTNKSTSKYFTSGYDNTEDVAVKEATPGFWTLIDRPNTVLPVNPYSRRITSGSAHIYCSGQLVTTEKAKPQRKIYRKYAFVYGCPMENVDTFAGLYASHISQARNDAKIAFANNIAHVLLDMPTELGEASKSARMIQSLVHDVSKGFIQLVSFTRSPRRVIQNFLRDGGKRRSMPTRVKSAVDTVNSRYLEYTYGIKPMTRSIESAGKVLEDQLVLHRLRKKAVGHSSFNFSEENFETQFLIPSGNGSKVKISRNQRIAYDVWVGGLLLSQYQGAASASQQLGLELSNIPMSLWELTRFSFILDYFSSLGGWLGNIRDMVGRMQPSTLYLSEKKVITTELVYKGLYIPPDTISNLYSGNGTGSNSSDVRTVIFNRSPISAATAAVSLNFRKPTGLQAFKSLSVAIQTLRVLK